MNLKILLRIVVILLRLGIFTFPGCKLCINYRRIKLHKQRKKLWKENRIFIVDCLSLSNVQLGKEFSKLSNERAGRANVFLLLIKSVVSDYLWFSINYFYSPEGKTVDIKKSSYKKVHKK